MGIDLMAGREHDRQNDIERDLMQARQQIVQFLSGAIQDASVLRRAITVLWNNAPDVLAQFPRLIKAQLDEAYASHIYARDRLPELFDLGDRAPTLMPAVYQHLSVCVVCQDEFAIIQDVMRSDAGEVPSHMRTGDRVLKAEGKTWKWYDNQIQEFISELRDGDVNDAVGGWQVYKLPSTIAAHVLPHPLKLILTLPDNIMKLEVKIEPTTRMQQDFWIAAISHLPTSATPPGLIMRVAFGQGDESTTGFRDLTRKSRAEFELLPTNADNLHQLFVEWGETSLTQRAHFDIPVSAK
jgi:hypothetical protein